MSVVHTGLLSPDSETDGAATRAGKVAMPAIVPLARFVLIPVAAKATGYSERAIHKKIDDGVWRRGREWRKAPDGRRLIDLQAVEAWIASSP